MEAESEWHECEQQHWGKAKASAVARNPGKTTSQIRREQRHRALQTVIARKHEHEQAGMAQSSTEGSESETRGRQMQQNHHVRYREADKAESEQQLSTRVTAGVGRDRREARTKREKPFKEMQRTIQSNRQPDRKQRTTAARMLTRMIESNTLGRMVHQQFTQARARARRERTAMLNKRDAVDPLAMIKRWKMQVNRDRSQQAVATANKLHSLLIEVEVKQKGTWKRVIVIADTGSGPTISRMVDAASSVEEYGMRPSCGNLVTADGSPLEGLCGSTAATMRWAGHTKEHKAWTGCT